MVRLDEWWCHCGKFQKLHMPCSHVVDACKDAHHEYKNCIHLVYNLESVSNMYRELLAELHNEAYLPPCHKLIICLDPDMKKILRVVLSFLVSTPK